MKTVKSLTCLYVKHMHNSVLIIESDKTYENQNLFNTGMFVIFDMYDEIYMHLYIKRPLVYVYIYIVVTTREFSENKVLNIVDVELWQLIIIIIIITWSKCNLNYVYVYIYGNFISIIILCRFFESMLLNYVNHCQNWTFQCFARVAEKKEYNGTNEKSDTRFICCVLSSLLPLRSVGRSNFDNGLHDLITLIKKTT